MLQENAEIDVLDGQIIRCLQLSPRIGFRTAASVLDVSEQTVARRYRRLVRDGIVRVTAVVDPAALGQSNWMVRTRCRPSGAESLARALAQRDDISWVTLLSGGSEIVCVLRARTTEARDDLLMAKLPRTAPVLDIEAVMVLHRFVGGGVTATDDWTLLDALLTPAQTRAVLAGAPYDPPTRVSRTRMLPEDEQIVDALIQDGRATYSALAHAGGMDEGRAARRLGVLLDSGTVYLDVDVSGAALGYDGAATVWLTVAPADLDRVGTALAGAAEVAYAAAITGRQNITASVICPSMQDLYGFITTTIAAIPGILSIETTPVLRHVKQAGALTTGTRLVPPGA